MKRISFLAVFTTVLCLCLTSNALAAMAVDGWASRNSPYYNGTTGGQGGTVVTVTNFANYVYYVNTVGTAKHIVQISGTINIGDGEAATSRIRANKTIRGIGENPTLIGNVRINNDEGNVIIENLNISNPNDVGQGDGISVKENLNNIFITKCTFYNSGDGNLDITKESDFVTVSWCKFYYTYNTGHNFVNLVGASDDQNVDADNLRVTFHHNWWTTLCKERMPRVRYGQVHVYNNYYSNLMAGGYCIGVGVGSYIRVENNYFNAVPLAWKDYYTDYPDHPVGHIGWNTGNIFYNCSLPTRTPAWVNEYSTIFTPPYDYMLEDTNDIPAVVQAYAGAGTPYPPHWHSTVYGDFDRDGAVERDDFSKFADYWLVTDCNAIADADYYVDCIVNFREFAKLAENWLK
jgi:pectate lyase